MANTLGDLWLLYVRPLDNTRYDLSDKIICEYGNGACYNSFRHRQQWCQPYHMNVITSFNVHSCRICHLLRSVTSKSWQIAELYPKACVFKNKYGMYRCVVGWVTILLLILIGGNWDITSVPGFPLQCLKLLYFCKKKTSIKLAVLWQMFWRGSNIFSAIWYQQCSILIVFYPPSWLFLFQNYSTLDDSNLMKLINFQCLKSSAHYTAS